MFGRCCSSVRIQLPKTMEALTDGGLGEQTWASEGFVRMAPLFCDSQRWIIQR
jgi:hypothetical protein